MAEIPTVETIVAGWLREKGYDGLVHPDEPCGCALADLMPCDSQEGQCMPAWKHVAVKDEGPVSKGEWGMFTQKVYPSREQWEALDG